MSAIIGPIPPFANVPIEAQNFQPSVFFISAITLGTTTTITTSLNHNYTTGQQVRLIIPPTFGTRQLNEQTGFVTSVPAANQVVLNISSIGMDPFKSSIATTKPQILAIGDNNTGAINAKGINSTLTFINGSFQNISL